jgi:hypothetical protein
MNAQFTLFCNYISHISYSNVNEISYFKDIANCILKKTPFELQPEDGFIKKPKHGANIIF